MQGQGDQGNGPFERLPTQDRPYLSGTGQHRAIMRNPNEGTSKHQAIQQVISQKTSEHRALPKRPPGMAHIDTPPEMPRAPRPNREQPVPPKNMRKRMLIFGGIAIVLAIVACTVGSLLASGINNSAGPSVTAVDFLSAMNTHNYPQAYKDLGPAITIRISQDQFTRQAQIVDTCYGPIKSYTEVPNSAKDQDSSQSYTYTLSREKSTKPTPYKLQLTLQKDPDDGTWKVTDYNNNNLGPAQPAPACTK
jgi:hypothetical protein